MVNERYSEDVEKRKSSTIIKDEGAYELIEGIENMELFLTENDEWQFHDSDIRDIHWNNQNRTLDLTIEPIGFCADVPWDRKTTTALLDFHYEGVEEFDLNCFGFCYIFELEINMKNGYLDCIFDAYILKILAKKLTINKPRLIKDE